MKPGRLSEEQMIHQLPRAERDEQPPGVLCREHGTSEQTFDRWHQELGGLSVSDAQRWRALEQGDTCLKRLLAGRDLAVEALQA